jgi:hypothetical protein
MIPIRNAVPSRYPPVVTWILIATNCLVFLFQDSLSPDELELFLIGIGGSLTTPPLPHHRTYGSVYGGSMG